jgi:hypothetical protein
MIVNQDLIGEATMAGRDLFADDAAAMAVRYQIANARCRPIEGRQGCPGAQIERALTRGAGTAVFYNSLLIKRGSVPPLVSDPDNYDFFRAVIQQEDGILDIDPALLDALRRYVLDADSSLIVRFPYAPAT